jgi:hypothetical protein
MQPDGVIVIPGGDPPQLQGSPHLERLKSPGEVILHTDRPSTAEDQVRRATNAVCLINSRGAVKWPGEMLRRLPRLKRITVCGIMQGQDEGPDPRAFGTTRRESGGACQGHPA